jgi:hypothetical protein
MIDWLIDWLVDALIDWLIIDCLNKNRVDVKYSVFTTFLPKKGGVPPAPTRLTWSISYT